MRLFNRDKREKIKDKFMKQQLEGAALITYEMPNSIVSERFRTLRTNIQFAQVDKKLKSLMITSSILAEGKSTVSANLAYVMQQTGQRVLLIDADLRKPSLHRTFHLPNNEGLSTLLSDVDGRLDINDILVRDKQTNLYLLTSGPIPPNPSELLGSARMQGLMSGLERYFDIIIYDTPPITLVTDAQIMASSIDGVLLVVRPNYVKKNEVSKSVEILRQVDANVLGFVANGIERTKDSNYYYYYQED